MKKNLFILVFGLIGVVLVSSCNKKRGCTNPTADNYDSEAVEDDDTCIPTRFKFIGTYDGYGTIEDEPNVLVSYDQVGVTITDETEDDQLKFIIGYSNFDVPVNTLDCVLNGTYDFNINRQPIGVYTYWGSGNINGRVLEIQMTRTEEITLPDLTTTLDTIFMNLYGLKDIE
ncbi:MAG: hypothetical protein ACI9UR_000907 [Bacteroidia bacterium]|jgi:hypothetical protein